MDGVSIEMKPEVDHHDVMIRTKVREVTILSQGIMRMRLVIKRIPIRNRVGQSKVIFRVMNDVLPPIIVHSRRAMKTASSNYRSREEEIDLASVRETLWEKIRDKSMTGE